MTKKKLYIAGDGLKKGNQILRKMEYEKINDLNKYDIYNPWLQEDINDKRNNPTAEMIFEKDTNAILKSNIIIADIDNNSVGTNCEMGQIWGINYMIQRLNYILVAAEDAIEDKDKRNEVIVNSIKQLLKEIPYKQVYWHTSDVRDETTSPEQGIRRSHSYNQYLIGMMLDLAGYPLNFEEIVKTLDKGELKNEG